MSNIYITFFHNSDNYIEKFTPKDEVRPSFYWFGDRYYNHYSITTRFKYFYLFVKNPKKDGIELRERYEGLGFNSLYSRFLKYKKEREQNLQKGIYNWLSPEPGIIMSFSVIVPDLIAKFDDDIAKTCTVIKPAQYEGVRFALFDKNNVPISFIDVPEICEILPNIISSYPFVEPKKEDKSQMRSSMNLRRGYNQKLKDNFKNNLARALNEGVMKNLKTY